MVKITSARLRFLQSRVMTVFVINFLRVCINLRLNTNQRQINRLKTIYHRQFLIKRTPKLIMSLIKNKMMPTRLKR